ncbi:MAG: type II secretion system F family protein [Halieaceae bacterium]|nr:type II secretion system F family protein [Halieaceae bacterium]
MTDYRYKAMDAYGKMQRGWLQAKNEMDVAFRLENQGLDLITCHRKRRQRLRMVAGAVSRRDLINMVFHLEQLTRSGVPLLEGLQDLRDSVSPGYFRDVLAGLVEEIEGGKNFSHALAAFPNDFDPVFVSLVGVGEEAGELPTVLKQMGDNLRWADELAANTKRILMYPSIVGVVIMGVATFLMVYLVPQIVPFVEELGGEIPGHTRALMAVSSVFVNYWAAILLLPAALIVVLRIAVKLRPEFKYWLDRLRLRLPLVGPILFRIKLARLATYMALLYSAGITVLRSLEICEDVVDNLYMARALATARGAIAEGRTISVSFASTDMFPPLVIRMLRVGEGTGNLDDALTNVSYFYDREVREAIETIEPAISPVLTVIMGLLLGWIMLSVLGPVWDTLAGIG